MRQFKINVNGNSYDVAVEEIIGGVAPVAAPQAQAVAPTPTPTPTPTPVAAAPVAEVAGESILAPMPGIIISASVEVGATVKKGDTLVILEAMKMENEISAPRDGVVVSINVSKAQNVNTGDVLVVLQ